MRKEPLIRSPNGRFHLGNEDKTRHFDGMSKVVNLNKFRKAKDRKDRRASADENAVKFGRTKAEKTLDRAEKDKSKRHLDGHSLSDIDDDATP